MNRRFVIVPMTILLLFLLWFPVTRRVVLILLPLGVRVDDFIAWALIIGLCLYLYTDIVRNAWFLVRQRARKEDKR